MANLPFEIPRDSSLHYWVKSWSNTEVYPSWLIGTGLAIYGAALARNVGFPQGRTGMIWPNMSVLLVGPSGDGKDSIIGPSIDLLQDIGCNIISGRTIEAVKASMAQLGDPAVGIINASELSAFLGCKDYQAGLVTELTDILSSGKRIDISLKSDIVRGQRKWIYNPTLTMFAGSTKEWLQKMLPEGSLDGGFLPRFMIIPEKGKELARIPPKANPGRYQSKEHKDLIEQLAQTFADHVRSMCIYYANRGGLTLFYETDGLDNAAGWYEEWYRNRLKNKPPEVLAYANRSANLMRRTAMLMAITRQHINYIEVADYEFAKGLIEFILERLPEAVLPLPRDVSAAHDILDLLPKTESEIKKILATKHGPLYVRQGLTHLVESGQAKVHEGKFVRVRKES